MKSILSACKVGHSILHKISSSFDALLYLSPVVCICKSRTEQPCIWLDLLVCTGFYSIIQFLVELGHQSMTLVLIYLCMRAWGASLSGWSFIYLFMIFHCFCIIFSGGAPAMVLATAGADKKVKLWLAPESNPSR